MSKLSLLILCLLVPCSLFSQIDTTKQKTKYVFLTEAQARANIKELIAYDALKLVSEQQEKRIKNLGEQIELYKGVVKKKDSVISYKDSIIDVQDKIINAKWIPKISGYGGLDFIGFDFNNPTFYFRSALEFRKISIGIQLNGRVSDQYNLPNLFGTLRAEFKIF